MEKSDKIKFASKISGLYHRFPKRLAAFIYVIYLYINYPGQRVLLHRIKKRKNAMKQIVVLGDSHAAFFSGNEGFDTKNIYIGKKIGFIQYENEKDDRFCVLRLGPGLAFNTNKRGSNTKTLEKYEWLKSYFLSGKEILIFAFGEIDIRTRVFKHGSEDDYKKTVENIVDNYLDFLKRVKNDGFKVIAWGPIPSQKDEWEQNECFPRCGSERQRNMATEYFNKKLNEKCRDNEIGFMTIFYDIIDKQYRTNERYYFDVCHLNREARPLLEKQMANIRKIISCEER